MAFSFYSSLKSIPRELREAADINRFSGVQRLVQLELPYAAIGLVWNSIMSVAGAWFTLMACEMFHFGTKDFRLPGLGSYLQTAADQGGGKAIACGLVTMIAIIVAIDQLIWRPLIAWSDKFKFEQVESSKHVSSPILHLFTHSNVLGAIAAAHHSAAQRGHLHPAGQAEEGAGRPPRPTSADAREPSRANRTLAPDSGRRRVVFSTPPNMQFSWCGRSPARSILDCSRAR